MTLRDVCMPELIYPCWAYALARVGKKDLFAIEWLKEDAPKLMKPYEGARYLKKGDLLVWRWDDDCRKTYEAVSMERDQVIFEKLIYDSHACVFEGDGFVSDMVSPETEFGLPFIIRKRRLARLSAPNYIIKLKDL